MKALIVVDYQYDFVDPSGSLYVPGAETIKNELEETIKQKKSEGYLIVFSKDWHPNNHVSFSEWPPHCIQGQKGSELCIDESLADLIILKGDKIDSDSYSVFYRSQNVDSGLEKLLREKNISELEICGVALDVCVLESYKDAKLKGFNSKILLDLSKAIDKNFVLVE